jgi:hypothetical protein
MLGILLWDPVIIHYPFSVNKTVVRTKNLDMFVVLLKCSVVHDCVSFMVCLIVAALSARNLVSAWTFLGSFVFRDMIKWTPYRSDAVMREILDQPSNESRKGRTS